MTDPSDDTGDERPRRRHRRASSPATTGHPDAGHWTKETPEGPAADDRPGESRADTAGAEGESQQRRVAGSNGGPESPRDRWWREQRPPHWE